MQEPESRMEVPPNQTIYINNLNEKVKKEGECKENFKYMSIILGKTTLSLSELCVTVQMQTVSDALKTNPVFQEY